MPTDTPDKLNINKMEAVANYVVRLTNFISESRLDGPFFSTDPVETEIYFLGKNIMPTLQSLGITLPPLNSRKDIDTLIHTLISKFGL
jgi:hypothetical protein